MNSRLKLTRWKVGWGITNKCNMNCPFCYSLDARKNKKDFPLSGLTDFIDRNHTFIDSINYGTGENTLANDWFELVKYIKSEYPSIQQALTTNGYLAQALKKRNDQEEILSTLDEVDVSMDYVEREKHNAWRGSKRAYDGALQTIHLCRDYQIKTTIVMIGTDQTLEIHNVLGLFELAKKNQCFIRINIFRPTRVQPVSLLSYDVLKKSLLYILNHHSVVTLSDPLFSAIILKEEKRDLSGIASLRIFPDGYISPSTYLVTKEWKRSHIRSANLGDQSISQHLLKGNEIGAVEIGECQNCPVGHICRGGAMDRRILWHHSLSKRDPYCPYLHGDFPENWKPDKAVQIAPGPDIHNGYLPTLIFKP